MFRIARVANAAAGRAGGLCRHLSTQPSAVTQWQKGCWDSYLASGRGSDALFKSIDTNESKSITASELKVFLESIGHRGVHPRSFYLLDDMAHDHPVSLKEFKSWLTIATKFGAMKNSEYVRAYGAQPGLGELREHDVHTEYSWNEVTMSQSVRRMQYAVRGTVVMRADKLAAEGKEILYTNIGNPQAVGTNPIAYYRQVMALCDLPAADGVDNPEVGKLFPQDVLETARAYRNYIGSGGTGAYSGSQGVLEFRKHVARFIEERDGHPSYPGNIFLTNGASSAIDLVLTTLIASDQDAVMIPIPQYPIYSAILARLGCHQVGYYQDESANWAAPASELEKRLQEAVNGGLEVKAMAIINPGNPTGQVFSWEDLEVICKFCAQNGIVLLADEVYQRNVYSDTKTFISAKKVALETPGCEHLQLVSFHSTSKGTIGECGRRGGYMELHNIDPYIQSQLYKLASSGLCSNLPGQLMTSLMVSPPQPGEASYDRFVEEETEIFEGLKRRSTMVVDGLNSIDGIDCNPAEGAMYCFPRLTLPPRAFEVAKSQDLTPDTMYALSLLDETGICVVPASGFGQEEGRVGFRTTFLPPEEKMLPAVEKFATHHKMFVEKYS